MSEDEQMSLWDGAPHAPVAEAKEPAAGPASGDPHPPEAPAPNGPRGGRPEVMGTVPMPRLAAKDAAELAQVRGLGRIFAEYHEVVDLDLAGLNIAGEASRAFWDFITPRLEEFVRNGDTPASWERRDLEGQVRLVLKGVTEREARGFWAAATRAMNKGEGGPGLAVVEPAFEAVSAPDGDPTSAETHIVLWPKESVRTIGGWPVPPVKFRSASSPGYVALVEKTAGRPYFADGYLWIRRGSEREGYRIGGLQTLLFPEGREALEALGRQRIEDLETEIQRLFRSPQPFPGVREAAVWALRCKIDRVKRWLARISAYDIGLDLALSVFEAFHRQRDHWAREELRLPDGRVVPTAPWRVIAVEPKSLRARLDPGRRWGRNWHGIVLDKLQALTTFERQVRDAKDRVVDAGDRFLTRVVDGRRGVKEGSAPESDSGLGLTRLLKARGAFPVNVFLLEVSVEFMGRYFASAADEKGRTRWGAAAVGAARRARLALSPGETKEARAAAREKSREVRARPYYEHSPRLTAVGNLDGWPLSRKLLAAAALQEVTPNFETAAGGRRRRSPNRLGGRAKLTFVDGRELVLCGGARGYGYRLVTWLGKAGHTPHGETSAGPGATSEPAPPQADTPPRAASTAGDPGRGALGVFIEDLAHLRAAIGLEPLLRLPAGAPGSAGAGPESWAGERALDVLRGLDGNLERGAGLMLRLYLPVDLEERLRARLAEAGIRAIDPDEVALPREGRALSPLDIRAARKKAGLTQAQLAARIGVSQRMLSFWESGRKPVPKDRRAAVGDALAELSRRTKVTEKGRRRTKNSRKALSVEPKSHGKLQTPDRQPESTQELT